jgi:DNA-binding transcriptional MerR regulator
MNLTTGSATSTQASQAPSRALQLFEPPANVAYTIEAAALFAGVPRRKILVYCKHGLLSPQMDERREGYSFDGDGIRLLRRIEALRMACGDDFAGIRIILGLTKELERLQAVVRFLSRNEWEPMPRADSRSKPRIGSSDRPNLQRYKKRK